VRGTVPELPKEVCEDDGETGEGRRRPGGCQRRRGAEARQVDGDHGPAGREKGDDRVPDAQAAAGPVDEHQGFARAVNLVIKPRFIGGIIAESAAGAETRRWSQIAPSGRYT